MKIIFQATFVLQMFLLLLTTAQQQLHCTGSLHLL
jgi:hypothetical protein